MATQSYNSPFTGDLVVPTDVSYNNLVLSDNSTLIWPDFGPVSTPTSNQYFYARIIDINALSTGLSLALPPGGQGSLGSDVLIRNIGANSVNITFSDGSNPVAIPGGISQWFYLVTNTSTAGFWNSVTFGAGVSAVNAVELAGGGLSVDSNAELAIGLNSEEISSTTVFNNTSWGKLYVWNGGTGAITLPTTISDTWTIAIKNNGTGPFTLNSPAGNYLVDGSTQIQLLPGESSFLVYSQGIAINNFYTIGRNRLANFYFSTSTQDITNNPVINLTRYATIIQTYTGGGAAATVQLPANVSTYYLVNKSSNPITFQAGTTALGATVQIASGTAATAVCDGTSIYATNVIPAGTFTMNSSATTPSITPSTDSTTGIFAATGVVGLKAGNGNALTVNQNLTTITGNVQVTIDGGYVI